MRRRWFGEPWPSAQNPASVCDDYEFQVETPVGKRCLYCRNLIEDGQRGVIMASGPEIPGRFVLTIEDPDTHERRPTYVVACHLPCLVRDTVGDEVFADQILAEMERLA